MYIPSEQCDRCSRPIEGDRLGKHNERGKIVCADEQRCSKPFVVHWGNAELKPMKGYGPLDGKLEKIIVIDEAGDKAVSFAIDVRGQKRPICPACLRTGDNPSIKWQKMDNFIYHEGCTTGMSSRDLMRFWVEYAPEEALYNAVFAEIL